MKQIIFILALFTGMGSLAQGKFIKDLKTKVKTAANSSVDRSTTKVVDKAINYPADNITDTTIDRAGKKFKSFFKKKKGKNKNNEPLPVVPVADSTVIKPKDTN